MELEDLGITPEEARRILYRIAGETAGLLRDLACTGEHLSERLRGETVQADVIAESYIIEAIREELGEARIVTEESGVVGRGDLTVVVDPLDGSSNYLNCIPWSSVSLAIAPSGQPITRALAGVVAPIFYGMPISFASGKGCYIGHTPVTPRRPPERFMFVYIDNPEAAHGVARIIGQLGGGFKVRSLGSAALEIAFTGLGRATAFVDLRSKLRNVDIAAAAGIVRECGGAILTDRGGIENVGTTSVERVGNIIVLSSGEQGETIARLAGWSTR